MALHLVSCEQPSEVGSLSPYVSDLGRQRGKVTRKHEFGTAKISRQLLLAPANTPRSDKFTASRFRHNDQMAAATKVRAAD